MIHIILFPDLIQIPKFLSLIFINYRKVLVALQLEKIYG
jgi:hypothetical protein